MRMIFQIASLLLFILLMQPVWAQEDSLSDQTLEEVVFSFNKWKQPLNEVPNKITKITKSAILRGNPQTAADLLMQSGTVFVQKSQLGGGSPMIRGFATNRVLLVVDGVRMNNAIYRSGNLQNIISLDPLSAETAEVIFGPGSLVYGSDAIGGVVDFRTLDAGFSKNGKTQIRGSALARYSSANKENTIHIDVNSSGKRWATLSSISYSDFGDLKMGRYGGEDRYLRKEYLERRGDQDILVQNSDPRVQKFSGYEQLNILQKIRFRATENLDLQYSFTYAGTGETPRYDRLIQYRAGALRFAEWNYGPMLWRMHNFQATHDKVNLFYDRSKLIIAYQNYEESRIDRARNSVNRNIQVEKLDAYSVNWDANKKIGSGELFYGLEYVFNKVNSTGERQNILSAASAPAVSRYPDGSIWSSSGVYTSFKTNLHPSLTLSSGLRYNFNALSSVFDKRFIEFPYERAEASRGSLTGNAGIVYRINESWQLSGVIATGFRMPNVDDMGKLFESAPGNITVPNPKLEAEYAWNFEAGIAKRMDDFFQMELNLFYTLLDNAIVRRPYTFNGSDSLLFDGILSRVEALQNVANASVWGVQFSTDIRLSKSLSWQTHLNFINGKETDDTRDEQVPLRHAAPFYGSSFLRYKFKVYSIEAFAFYNSKISNSDLAPSEQAKGDIYAIDTNGNPYSPAWYTLNLRASIPINRSLVFTAAWENITNQRYRPYSSGIVSAGSNLIVSLRTNF